MAVQIAEKAERSTAALEAPLPLSPLPSLAKQLSAALSVPKLVGVFGVACFFRCLTLIPISIDVDEAWYAASAAALSSPFDFFQRALDNKPPGTVWFYWLVQSLFHSGADPRLVRCGFLFFGLLGAWLVGRSVTRITRDRALGWLAGLLCFLTSVLPSIDVVSTNAEGVAATVLCGLMGTSFEVLALKKRIAPQRWAFFGFVAGLAILFKQTAVFIVLAAFLSMIFLWRQGLERPRSMLIFLVSAILPVGLAAFFLGWHDFAYWTTIYPAQVLSPTRDRIFASEHPLAIHVLEFVAVLWPLFACLRARIFLRMPVSLRGLFLIWAIPGVATVALGKGLFFHYFAFLSPPLCLLFACTLVPTEKQRASRAVFWLAGAQAAICLVAAIPSFGLFWGADLGYYARVGQVLRELTNPSDKVFVWGGNALALVASGRVHPTRFVTARFVAPPWGTPETIALFREEFLRDEPAVVVDLHQRGDERFALPVDFVPWLRRELRNKYSIYRDPNLPWATFYVNNLTGAQVAHRIPASHMVGSPESDFDLFLGDSSSSIATIIRSARNWRHVAVLQSLLRDRDALRRLPKSDAGLSGRLEQAIAHEVDFVEDRAPSATAQEWSRNDREFAEQARNQILRDYDTRHMPHPLSLDSWAWWISVALVKFQPVVAPRESSS